MHYHLDEFIGVVADKAVTMGYSLGDFIGPSADAMKSLRNSKTRDELLPKLISKQVHAGDIV
jgi:hypothetical protein